MLNSLRGQIFLMFLALALPAHESYAYHNLLFQNYTSKEGLPNTSICSFAQDRFGFVWVGTDEGICMFDGESFFTPMFLQQEPFLSATGRGMCIDSRNVLWLISKEGLLNYNLETGESRAFKEYRAQKILCDGDGTIWLLHRSGLSCYYPGTDKWDKSPSDDFSPVNFCVNSSGELCVTATDGCIYIKHRGESDFSRLAVLSDEELKKGLSLVGIAACDGRRILFSTSDNSSFCLDLRSGKTRKFFDGHLDGKDAILTGIQAETSQRYWVATDNGLFVYEDEERTCTKYMNHSGDPYSLASSKLRCMFKDNQDRIWLGTFYDGVSRVMDYGSDTRIFRICPDNPAYSLGGRTVHSICAGDHGLVWAATEDGYLEKVYPDGKIITFGFGHEKDSRTNTYQSATYIDGMVYVVSLGSGLSVYDAESLKLVKRYDVGDNYCKQILQTRHNELLVGTSSGLFRYENASDSFVRIESTGHNFISAICEDWQGDIWVNDFQNGICVLTPPDYEPKPLEISDGTDIGRVNISSLFEDRDGRIWAATGRSGLFIFHPNRNEPWKVQFNNITKQDGLPSDIISAITQDESGRMWVSTMNGIASIEWDAIADVTEYRAIGNSFCPGAVLNSPDGRIYFGSSEGMVAFNPEEIPIRKHKLFLADIAKINNSTITSVSESGRAPFTTESIRIRSSETSSLAIRLMCLKTDMNDVMRYRYSLTGKGRTTVSISNEKQITYANLAPGRYTFTANVNQDSAPEASVSLQIQVIPPVYASLLAKLLYIILVLEMISSYLYYSTAWERKERERVNERLESDKQKEAYESKINFFTNVSHEIRTPLTLIKVPLDKIMESKAYLPEAEADMKVIQNSTDKLLEITEQILDFRKMENGSAQLSFTLTDLSKLIEDVCTRMRVIANEYSVSLDVKLAEDTVLIMCAPDSVEKIITNLLMNGIKYCKSKVGVVMERISDDKVKISVSSDGPAIHQEDRDKIFEPFYQSSKIHSRLPMNEGTGLGLPFAKALAELHKGTLTLDTDYSDGNSFILELPVGQTTEHAESEEDNNSQYDVQDTGRYSILVVEDDATLNNYLKKELSDEYVVYQSYNGKQALKLLKDKSISLIVSDVMMPEMDGRELVGIVKDTLKFSHIPIILLTAVTDYDTQLESLHSGADGYITKPFSIQLLRATIFNILKNREIIFERFSSMPYTRLENLASSQDEDFMKKLYDYVMKNISNQELSVLDLADNMNASRSTLFRKVKANTGLNINEYIRVCRLKKAAELLSEQKYHTKEVAYMVGFTSLSYFTKSFKKQFNISPSSLLKKATPQTNHTITK